MANISAEYGEYLLIFFIFLFTLHGAGVAISITRHFLDIIIGLDVHHYLYSLCRLYCALSLCVFYSWLWKLFDLRFKRKSP